MTFRMVALVMVWMSAIGCEGGSGVTDTGEPPSPCAMAEFDVTEFDATGCFTD